MYTWLFNTCRLEVLLKSLSRPHLIIFIGNSGRYLQKRFKLKEIECSKYYRLCKYCKFCK